MDCLELKPKPFCGLGHLRQTWDALQGTDTCTFRQFHSPSHTRTPASSWSLTATLPSLMYLNRTKREIKHVPPFGQMLRGIETAGVSPTAPQVSARTVWDWLSDPAVVEVNSSQGWGSLKKGLSNRAPQTGHIVKSEPESCSLGGHGLCSLDRVDSATVWKLRCFTPPQNSSS